MEKQIPNLNIKLESTQPLKDSEGNHIILAEGVLMRTVSKFLIGQDETGMIPFPIFYDVKTNKILLESVPKEIRSEYKEVGFSL